MQVVKPVGWWHLLKRPALMDDLNIRSIRSPVDLVSLLPDLEIMMNLDLVMMDLELEVAIKHHVGCVKWHHSVAKVEVEGELCAEY